MDQIDVVGVVVVEHVARRAHQQRRAGRRQGSVRQANHAGRSILARDACEQRADRGRLNPAEHEPVPIEQAALRGMDRDAWQIGSEIGGGPRGDALQHWCDHAITSASRSARSSAVRPSRPPMISTVCWPSSG
jgi:hypothetical protein